MVPAVPEMPAQTAGRQSPWKVVVGTLAGIFLGGVFLFATYGKALDPASFAELIRAEKLDFLVPSGPLALLVLGAEAAIAFALLLNLRRLWVLIPTALLVAFFLFLTGKTYVLWLNGEEPAMASCGCFGNLVDHNPAEAFWRDVLLFLPATVLSFLGRPRGPFPWKRTVIASILTLGATGFAWKAPDLPLDDVATRLKPGVKAAEVCVGEGEDEICLTSPAVEPLLATGSHIVVIADLLDEAFAELAIERTEDLFVRMGEPDLPQVVVLHPGKKADEAAFQFLSAGAPLELRVAPRPLLRPLYRSLPRTFLLVDGIVRETWPGFPPLAELRAE